MYAVIQTGGKQYKVAHGDMLKVEKLEAKQGEAQKPEKFCGQYPTSKEAPPSSR